QMCYPPVAEILASADGRTPLRLPPGYLKRTGYRLPTEAEWEYACRAGSLASRYYGSATDMLNHHGWHVLNAQEQPRPVGQKKPNGLGLFDTLGNVAEWCQSSRSAGARGRAAADEEEETAVVDQSSRGVRGASFEWMPVLLRSADRFANRPTYNGISIGLRVARTCR